MRIKMKKLNQWIEKQRNREKRTIFLEDALLSNRFSSYTIYRMRFFMVRHLLEAILHGIEFTFLTSIFSIDLLISLLVLKLVHNVITSFWWGALEDMRNEIRYLSREGRPHLIPEEISRWLSNAILLAPIPLIICVVWIIHDLNNDIHTFGVLHLYIFSIALRLSLNFIVRTYHSGVYAIKRVYRPLLSIFAVQFISFFGVLGLWPWLKEWSFPIMMVITPFVTSWLTIYYTSRIYRFFNFSSLKLFNRERYHRQPRADRIIRFFLSGFSYCIIKTYALISIFLFLKPSGDMSSGMAHFAILLYIISPMIHATYDWAQLYYFDFKRLELDLFDNLKKRFIKLLFHLSWIFGIVFWGLASIFGSLFLQTNLGLTYCLLLPFFLSRSILAIIQIRAFSHRQFGALIISGLVFILITLTLKQLSLSNELKLLSLSAMSLGVAVLLRKLHSIWKDPLQESRIYPFASWLDKTTNLKGPIRIRSVRFWIQDQKERRITKENWAAENQWRRVRLAELVAKKLTPWSWGYRETYGLVTIVYPDRISWVECEDNPNPIQDKWLVHMGGGLLDRIKTTPYYAYPQYAMKIAAERNYLGKTISNMDLFKPSCISSEEVKRFFTNTFPNGIVFDSDKPIPDKFHLLKSQDRKEILSNAIQYTNNSNHHSKGALPYDVTSFSPKGKLNLIFLVNKKEHAHHYSKWRKFIERANIKATLSISSGIY